MILHLYGCWRSFACDDHVTCLTTTTPSLMLAEGMVGVRPLKPTGLALAAVPTIASLLTDVY